MPILQIAHEDGRVFNVAEQAYEDLYKPFGFKPTHVVFAGANHPFNKENLEEARTYEERGFSPNETSLTLEASARAAIATSLDDTLSDDVREGAANRAEGLIKTAKALQKEELSKKGGFITYPPKNDEGVEVESSTETALKAKRVTVEESASPAEAVATGGTGIPAPATTPIETPKKPTKGKDNE
jgi:hypothetical protein